MYNEMCQHVEDLHNSSEQYFPNDQSMLLQNHVKDPFKAQGKPMDFNATAQKCIDVVSNSTLQLFKTL